MELIRREAIYLWYYCSVQFHQMFPYWVFGMVMGSLVSVFLKKHIHAMMASLQSRSMGICGILPASALGILSPLCMYGTVPIVASIARSGMREDWIAAFMMSSILLNPQLLFYSFALGTELAVLRLYGHAFRRNRFISLPPSTCQVTTTPSPVSCCAF